MKQKTFFDDNEIAHQWAHRVVPQGHSRGRRMNFSGDLFQSYSTGIARLGKHKGKDYVILNTRSFSPTTSKHQGAVRHATSHLRQFTGDFGGFHNDLLLKPSDIVKHYVKGANESLAEKTKTKPARYKVVVSAIHKFIKAREAAKFFGLGFTKIQQAADKASAELKTLEEAFRAYRAKIDANTERREKARQEFWRRHNERSKEEFNRELAEFLADHTKPAPDRWRVEQTEHLAAYDAQVKVKEDREAEDWLAGRTDRIAYGKPVLLRVVGYDIETSHGAIIPYEEGRKTFVFATKLRTKGWHRNGEQFKVGDYELDAVNEQGIVAGCHRISWETIEAFAKQEGWMQS